MIKEKINTNAKITNKEAEEAEEIEEETMGILEGDIVNQRQSSKMDTIGHVDGKQTTKAPDVSDFRKAELQARPVPIQRMVEIWIKGGTDGLGGGALSKLNLTMENFMLQQMRLSLVILENYRLQKR